MDNVNTNIRMKTNDAILFLLPIIFIVTVLTNAETTLWMIISFALFLCLILINIKKIKIGYILLILINALSCVCTAVLYEGLGVVLIFLILLLACICFNSISFSEKARKWAYIACCVGLLLIIITASDIDRPYGWLVLIDKNGNLINNNTLGIFSVGFCFCALAWNELRKSKKCKMAITVISFGVSFFFAYLTGCRSAIFVLLCYVVISLVMRKKLTDKTFRRIIILLMLSSLLFTVFYVTIYSVWPNATILGKSLFSGRELIWKEAFEQINNHMLFGSGTEFSAGGFESMHNMLLGIWKNVGLIPVISIISVFTIRGRVTISRKQQIMIFSMLIFAFFESFMMDFRFLLLFAFLMTGTNENKAIEENGDEK